MQAARVPHLAIVLALALLHLAVAVLPAAAQAYRLDDTLRSAHARLDWSHPLAGRFSTDGERSRSVDELSVLPAGHDVVLLGEIHDNPVHHTLRALLIASGLLTGPRPAIVAEHVRADQQQAIDVLQAADIAPTTDDFFEALEWAKSGWPDKHMFEPLFAVAIGARLPILAGNPEREQVRQVARGGVAALPPSLADRLKLATGLEPPLEGALLAELEASHCGLVPKAAFTGMAAAQRLRDAWMAATLAFARSEQGRAVLLAGNGHVRADRGVPWHLRRLAPGLRALAVVVAEVAAGKDSPADYFPRAPDGSAAADLVIFTPAVSRPDPCEVMRKHMGR